MAPIVDTFLATPLPADVSNLSAEALEEMEERGWSLATHDLPTRIQENYPGLESSRWIAERKTKEPTVWARASPADLPLFQHYRRLPLEISCDGVVSRVTVEEYLSAQRAEHQVAALGDKLRALAKGDQIPQDIGAACEAMRDIFCFAVQARVAGHDRVANEGWDLAMALYFAGPGRCVYRLFPKELYSKAIAVVQKQLLDDKNAAHPYRKLYQKALFNFATIQSSEQKTEAAPQVINTPSPATSLHINHLFMLCFTHPALSEYQKELLRSDVYKVLASNAHDHTKGICVSLALDGCPTLELDLRQSPLFAAIEQALQAQWKVDGVEGMEPLFNTPPVLSINLNDSLAPAALHGASKHTPIDQHYGIGLRKQSLQPLATDRKRKRSSPIEGRLHPAYHDGEDKEAALEEATRFAVAHQTESERRHGYLAHNYNLSLSRQRAQFLSISNFAPAMSLPSMSFGIDGLDGMLGAVDNIPPLV